MLLPTFIAGLLPVLILKIKTVVKSKFSPLCEKGIYGGLCGVLTRVSLRGGGRGVLS